MLTLPDYLQHHLNVLFIGINPGLKSAMVGQYFTTTQNRFWSAFNTVKIAPEALGPNTGPNCLIHGIGFTDIVKRATQTMASIKASEFQEGAKLLHAKLIHYQPKLACFNGLTAYQNFAKYRFGNSSKIKAGIQDYVVGKTKIFVIPSTSPANAAVSIETIVKQMGELKKLIDSLK